MKTLKDWLPQDGLLYIGKQGEKMLDQRLTAEYGLGSQRSSWKRWPGKHKNVLNWCILENGYAVGWNENPSIGWSFPVIKMKGK